MTVIVGSQELFLGAVAVNFSYLEPSYGIVSDITDSVREDVSVCLLLVVGMWVCIGLRLI